jgi:tetratricopeptide (TPR) repeat protein
MPSLQQHLRAQVILLSFLLACSGSNEDGREVLNDEGATAIPGGYSDYEADYGLAVEAVAAGDLAAAEKIYQGLAIKEPASASPWVGLGSLAVMGGDLDTAETNYQRATQMDPKLLTAHIGLGTVDMERGAYSEALPHYQQASELQPDSPDVHLALHNAYRELGDIAGAKAHGRKYVELAPDDASAAWVKSWLAAQP